MEVEDATTWEMVMVRVNLAVEVIVVVQEVSAAARRGRRRRVEMVGAFILMDGFGRCMSNKYAKISSSM